MTVPDPQRVALVAGTGSSYVTGITVYPDGRRAALKGVVIRSA